MNRSDIDIDGDRWVQFSPGEPFTVWYAEGVEGRESMPPADWQDPTCETCGGEGEWVPPMTTIVHLCPHCIKRRIAVTEPCPRRCQDSRSPYAVLCPCNDGLVTVAHVVQDWGPLEVLAGIGRAKTNDALVLEAGTIWLVRRQGDELIERGLTLPPDVDPQTLVGQWARGGRVVE